MYIYIALLDFERRYPQGSKAMFYKKAKVELYAPYFQMDGLIQRVTVYEDYEYTTPIRCYEKYLNRNDCLTESTKDFNTDTITDFFEKGRLDHCKGETISSKLKISLCESSIFIFFILTLRNINSKSLSRI